MQEAIKGDAVVNHASCSESKDPGFYSPHTAHRMCCELNSGQQRKVFPFLTLYLPYKDLVLFVVSVVVGILNFTVEYFRHSSKNKVP